MALSPQRIPVPIRIPPKLIMGPPPFFDLITLKNLLAFKHKTMGWYKSSIRFLEYMDHPMDKYA
jgi:hypothetical protein